MSNQSNQSNSKYIPGRLWIDGCFDFTHHGHAGALRQARALGNELYVGIHTDEEIEFNKGPAVMHLDERIIAVEACKWCTKTVPGAPYVTRPSVLDKYQCEFVVHGDDITTDAEGNDCYQEVKDLGRFLVVKRTPNISTTDLVGRMLSMSTGHHLPRLTNSNKKTHSLLTADSITRFTDYAKGLNARDSGSGVYAWIDDRLELVVKPCEKVAKGLEKKVYYVDGGFDLFFTGHIETLSKVRRLAEDVDALVVVGIHDDQTVNQAKGHNYPIMNEFERILCVLQCRYVDAVIIGAPFIPDEAFIKSLTPNINVVRVIHGPTPVTSDRGAGHTDPYIYCKEQGIYQDLGPHKYMDVTTSTLVDRVLANRLTYEERQRKKGWKSVHEKELEKGEKERNGGTEEGRVDE